MNLWMTGGLGVVLAGTFFLAYRQDRRAAAARVEAELRSRFRDHPQSALIQLREPYMTRIGELEREEEAAERDATTAEGKRETWSAQVWRGREPKLGFVIVIGVLSLIWAFLFVLQRLMDITVMQALRSVEPQLFGNVIALVFAVVGILLSGIAGVHHLLPSWMEPKRVLTRVALGIGLVLLALMLMLKVASLAQYRSIDRFSQAVDNDSATVQQLQGQRPTHAQLVEISSAQATLQQDRQRLANAKNLDKTLTVSVLSIELAVAGAPVFGAEMATLGVLGWTARRHRRRQRRAITRRAALPQEFREQAATQLAIAHPDWTPVAIDALIASLNPGPEPAGPEPAGPEPAGPEPAGPEPAGPEPAGPEPAGPEPAGPEPAGPEPGHGVGPTRRNSGRSGLGPTGPEPPPEDGLWDPWIAA